MDPQWLHRHRRRTWLVVLFLPVLAVRLLVPAGFMPGTDANQTITMQMCHGAGPIPVVGGVVDDGSAANPDSGTGRRDGDARHGDTCIFASTGSVATPLTISVLENAIPAADDVCAGFASAVSQRSMHHPHSLRTPPPVV